MRPLIAMTLLLSAGCVDETGYMDPPVGELDPSGLSGSDLPFIKYESRGYQILILPPMEGELGREVETTPVADTDDHRF